MINVALCTISPDGHGEYSSPQDVLAALDDLGARAVVVIAESASIAVATEIVDAPWRCASAPILAGELRRRGLAAGLERLPADPGTAELLRLVADSGRLVAYLTGAGADPAVGSA